MVGAKADLFGKCLIFIFLCVFEVTPAPVKQGRRIGHGRVEPVAVEVIAEVVMGVDIALGTACDYWASCERRVKYFIKQQFQGVAGINSYFHLKV